MSECKQCFGTGKVRLQNGTYITCQDCATGCEMCDHLKAELDEATGTVESERIFHLKTIDRLKAELAAAKVAQHFAGLRADNAEMREDFLKAENAKLRALCLRVACLSTTLPIGMREILASAGRGEGGE